jgi:hypothetical protein
VARGGGNCGLPVDGQQASQQGSGGAGGSSGSACTHPFFPPAPTVKNQGGTITFTGAVHKVFLTEGDGGRPLGLDLDSTCTCPEAQTCLPSGPSMDNKFYCDDPEGRDASSVRLFKTSGLVTKGDINKFYSDSAHKGRWGFLVRVSDYNGKADDDQVTVTVIGAAGFPGLGEPKWDGTDKWDVSSASFEEEPKGKPNPNKPKHFDKNAYVTNFRIVASLPETDITLAGSAERITFRLKSSGMVARIATDTSCRFVLREGLIVGRFGAKEAFAALASYRDAKGNAICTNAAFYGVVRDAVCNSLDILKEAGSPTQACDAVSFAVGFETDAADTGMIVPAPMGGSKCMPATTDPANDCCDCPFGFMLKKDGTCRCEKL